jgi:hypothetical protein
MGIETVKKFKGHEVDIRKLTESILTTQLGSGEIPWHEGGKTDPWDHVESAMGLTVGSCLDEAKKAYEWLAGIQLNDGSWYSAYNNGEPTDKTKESNMSSYLAVGVFHYYLVSGDKRFLQTIWPSVNAGIDYALNMQSPSGEIYWARNSEGVIDPMALLTGSSSIFLSLRCALAIAYILGKNKPDWEKSIVRLRDAIRFRPHLFNREKARFSMDWFYPVLSGAMTGLEAIKRVEKSWDKFVVEGLGIRCVSDRPWATMAETSEFTLALAGMGKYDLAEKVFSWISDKKFDDGTYWCGVTFPDGVIWPEEKITWTNAVVMMAYDTLNSLTAGAHLFSHSFWESAVFSSGRKTWFRGETFSQEEKQPEHQLEVRGQI